MPHGHGHGKRPGNSQKADKTIQSLLAPKKDLITKEKPTEKSVKENPPKVAKRNHSDLDSSNDHSMDFTNIAQDLEDIKKSLKDNIKKEDLTQAIEGIVKQLDIENIVTNIVQKLLSELKSDMKKEINKQISENQQKQSDELQTLKNENSGLKKAIQEQGEQIREMKNDMYEVYNKSYEAISMANYNEQYSRKFNIKLINYPVQNNENLRKNFVSTVKEELKVNIEERDIIAIHRLPTRTRGPPPVIVKIVNSDIKSNIMKKKKLMRNNVKMYDDVTTRNRDLLYRLKKHQDIEQAYYYNSFVYGRTKEGLCIRFDICNDIQDRIDFERGVTESKLEEGHGQSIEWN